MMSQLGFSLSQIPEEDCTNTREAMDLRVGKKRAIVSYACDLYNMLSPGESQIKGESSKLEWYTKEKYPTPTAFGILITSWRRQADNQ